jgi:hypothetical protein
MESGKKEKNCNPEYPKDEGCGDIWDHIAFDPENRLVICVITGKRTAKNTRKNSKGIQNENWREDYASYHN